MSWPRIPNIALMRQVELAILARDHPTGFTHAAIKVLILTDTVESDATFVTRTSVADILAHSTEASFGGYARKAYGTSDITVTVDQVGNKVQLDLPDISTTVGNAWNPTTAQNTGAIIFYFDPDTTASNDSNNVPLFGDAFVETTGTGGVLTPLQYVLAAGGILSGVQG